MKDRIGKKYCFSAKFPGLKKDMMYDSYSHMIQKNKHTHVCTHICVCVHCVSREKDKCGIILKMVNLGKGFKGIPCISLATCL